MRKHSAFAYGAFCTPLPVWKWFFTLLAAVLFLPLSGNAKETKPELEQWKIDGASAAFQDVQLGVRVLALNTLRDLEALGTIPKERIADMLEAPDEDVRWAAAKALGALGSAAQGQAPQLGALLTDPDADVREAAAAAPGALGAAAQG